MAVHAGDIVKGVVTGVANFGCFITLEDGTSGLCHISEVSNDFVKNVSDYVQKDQEVTVKVLEVTGEKVALSIKALQPVKPKTEPLRERREQPRRSRRDDAENQTFEEKMAKYLKEANERIQSINQRNSRRRKSSKPRR